MGFAKRMGAATGGTIAPENAQKPPKFARSYAIQTRRGRDDWKVASAGEADAESFPSIETIGGYGPFYYTGNPYLLDVRAAARDRRREPKGEARGQGAGSIDQAVAARLLLLA
jgi:hypothetical protein